MTDYELALRTRFEETYRAVNVLELEIRDYYMPLLRDRLDAGDIPAAQELIRRCPSESITWVFMLDQLREARKRLGL